MSCVLRAIGTDFDPGSFLTASPLESASVYHKGEPIASGAQQTRTRAASGFNATVSTAGFDDLAGQIQDAIVFLDQHEDEIRRLTAFPGVEQVFMDFGVRWRDVATQSDVLPSELLWKLGALDQATMGGGRQGPRREA